VNPHRVGRCGHRPGREAEQRHNGHLLSPTQDSDTHVRSVEFFCHSRARVWRARPNSAGGGGEGPGFFARQPRARMTDQEIEQDRNCHYDLQSSIDVLKLLGLRDPLPRFVVDLLERGCNLYASFQACSARAMRSARPLAGQCLRMNAATFGLVFATGFIDEAEAFVTPFARFLLGEEECFGRSPLILSIYH
jgi:hypothetical protein